MAIVMSYELTDTEALTRSQVINALKRAFVMGGQFWFDSYAHKRFTESGAREYNFRRRSFRYSQLKKKHFGHELPLVLTGEGRALTLSDATRQKIKASRDKITIRLPQKFNLHNPKGPNMPKELRAVSRNELRAMEEFLVVAIESELDGAVPRGKRNRGYIGGRVGRINLAPHRPSSMPRSAAPAALRKAG